MADREVEMVDDPVGHDYVFNPVFRQIRYDTML
jgi:hypothetical protein